MKEGTAPSIVSTVREFMHIISAQANAALAGIERPGFLQISRLHPSSEQLVPSRYTLDDVEHMVSAAITDSENGHNVYCEGRTVREDLRGNAPRHARRHPRRVRPGRRQRRRQGHGLDPDRARRA